MKSTKPPKTEDQPQNPVPKNPITETKTQNTKNNDKHLGTERKEG